MSAVGCVRADVSPVVGPEPNARGASREDQGDFVSSIWRKTAPIKRATARLDEAASRGRPLPFGRRPGVSPEHPGDLQCTACVSRCLDGGSAGGSSLSSSTRDQQTDKNEDQCCPKGAGKVAVCLKPVTLKLECVWAQVERVLANPCFEAPRDYPPEKDWDDGYGESHEYEESANGRRQRREPQAGKYRVSYPATVQREQ